MPSRLPCTCKVACGTEPSSRSKHHTYDSMQVLEVTVVMEVLGESAVALVVVGSVVVEEERVEREEMGFRHRTS